MNMETNSPTELELVDALSQAFTTSPAELAALNRRLSVSADSEGLIDVSFTRIESPFGGLLIAATASGVVRLAFELENHESVLIELARTIGPRIIESSLRVETAAQQLREYFAGERRRFDLDIDLRLVSGFRHKVVAHLSQIPYGSTASYGALADAVGNPKAVRAVGSACSHNPVPILVPCHRVVRTDGSIGNYLGGTEVKRALLALEAA